jgi:hypothetical protein
MLSGLQTTLAGFSKGSANFDPNTLRVVLASNQPRIPAAFNTATMSPIAITSLGDNTIISPAAGKALRIGAIAMTSATLVAIQIKSGTVAQGQSSMSALMSISDFSESFTSPIALAVDRSLVIGLGTASATVSGYVTWWEE